MIGCLARVFLRLGDRAPPARRSISQALQSCRPPLPLEWYDPSLNVSACFIRDRNVCSGITAARHDQGQRRQDGSCHGAGQLRHRHRRIRHHGPDARYRQPLATERATSWPCHQRLRAGCGGRRPDPGHPRCQAAAQAHAAVADGALCHRQPGHRLCPVIHQHGGLPLHQRPAPWRLLRHRRRGGVEHGAEQPARRRRGTGDDGPDPGDAVGQPGGNLPRPVVRLAFGVRFGRYHRPVHHCPGLAIRAATRR